MDQIKADELLKDLHFPKAGMDVACPFGKQPNRNVGPGKSDYARTTPLGLNVRTYEPTSNRSRGGSRAGLVKHLPVQVNGEYFVVQELYTLVGSGYSPPGGGAVQTSQSGRVVTLVAVSQGQVRIANPGDTAWSSPTNSTGEDPPLSFTGIMFSAANNQKLWFADGTNWVYYDPHTNVLLPWVATAGVLPVDSDGNTPRLICTWRGRTVLSGLLLDPQNWFMSRVAVPTDYDYSPLSTSPDQAIAGNNSPLGLIGDVVTSLVPYSDDVMIFGGDHTIYMMRGDPMAGGQIDLISDAIGMAFGMPWTKDPFGTLYFYSNRCGIYTLVPGQAPQRISQQIEQILQQIDTGQNAIRMLWDDRFQGCHVFITPLVEPGATTHFFYEARAGAWWQDRFADHNHDPLCCVAFDGNDANDRTPLIGSWDGYVRAISPEATTDDGVAIDSSVLIGPFLTADMDDVLLKDIQAILSMNTATTVTFEVFQGSTAEVALASTPVFSGTWGPGRNMSNFIRKTAHATYIKVSSSSPWALEQIRIRIAGQGKVRRRGA